MAEDGRVMGPWGYCVCPKGGFKKTHESRIPCSSEKCPHCNIRLLREGSYHHILIEENRTKREKGGY